MLGRQSRTEACRSRIKDLLQYEAPAQNAEKGTNKLRKEDTKRKDAQDDVVDEAKERRAPNEQSMTSSSGNAVAISSAAGTW